MADFLLDMEWHRCPEGYHRAPAPERSGAREWILPNSIFRLTYRPFQKFDMLYSAFAKIKTDDDLLDFINRFGPLGSGAELDVPRNLRHAGYFRELLLAKQKGQKRVWSAFRLQNALEEIEYARRRTSQKIDLNRVIESEPSRYIGTVSLEPDSINGVRIKIEPYSLMSGLWVQLARKLSESTIIRTCRYCDSLFEAGHGSSKRADATFCCSKHSQRFHSLRRAKGG